MYHHEVGARGFHIGMSKKTFFRFTDEKNRGLPEVEGRHVDRLGEGYHGSDLSLVTGLGPGRLTRLVAYGQRSEAAPEVPSLADGPGNR